MIPIPMTVKNDRLILLSILLALGRYCWEMVIVLAR